MQGAALPYVLNQYTPDPAVVFDRTIGDTYIRYAHMPRATM